MFCCDKESILGTLGTGNGAAESKRGYPERERVVTLQTLALSHLPSRKENEANESCEILEYSVKVTSFDVRKMMIFTSDGTATCVSAMIANLEHSLASADSVSKHETFCCVIKDLPSRVLNLPSTIFGFGRLQGVKRWRLGSYSSLIVNSAAQSGGPGCPHKNLMGRQDLTVRWGDRGDERRAGMQLRKRAGMREEGRDGGGESCLIV